MQVEIGEIESTVRATDSQALLDPQVIERIVSVVLKRIRQTQERERRARGEREVRPAASARNVPNWR